jgi:hypothetical protein
VQQWPSWPYATTCGGKGFDPIAVFGSPVGVGAEDGSSPAEAALRDLTQNQEYASIFKGHEEGWRLVSETPGSASFVWGQLPYLMAVTVAESEGAWGYQGGSYGCIPRSVIGEHLAVEWELVPQPKLREDTRSILVNLGSGGGCAGKGGWSARADRPRFRQAGQKLLIAIGVKPLSRPPFSWLTSCAREAGPPLEVKLPGRLGRRTLFDAGTYPPQRRAQAGGRGWAGSPLPRPN